MCYNLGKVHTNNTTSVLKMTHKHEDVHELRKCYIPPEINSGGEVTDDWLELWVT